MYNIFVVFLSFCAFLNAECSEVFEEKIVTSKEMLSKGIFNDFIVLRMGGGYGSLMNNIVYDKSDDKKKFINYVPILNSVVSRINGNSNFKWSKIGKNIKEFGGNYFLSDFNFGVDLVYNKLLNKHFFLILGVGGRFESKLIKDTYLRQTNIYWIERQNGIYDRINDRFEKEESGSVENDDVQEKKRIINKIVDERFEYLHETVAKNFDVYSLQFLKAGGCLGFSFMFSKSNYEKSFFVSLQLFIRYRKLLNFAIMSKNKDGRRFYEENCIRVNPFDVALGFEFGKNNIASVLVEIGLNSILADIDCRLVESEGRAEWKNGIRIRDISMSIRFSKF